MLDTMALVIAGNNEANLGELTRYRTACAVPFGGRYRLVDFVLSNIVNSGIHNVGIATDHRYQSLLNHLGNGKPWDLARKKEGMLIIPPYSCDAELVGDGRLSILKGTIAFLERQRDKYVVLCDGTNVCNMQFEEIVDLHRQRNADITVVYQQEEKRKTNEYYIALNDEKRVVDIVYAKEKKESLNRLVGYYVFTKDLLISVLEDAILHNKYSFVKDIIEANIGRLAIYGHKLATPLRSINNIQDFYDVSMELLSHDFRGSLFETDYKIMTKSKDRVPARYLTNAKVRNSTVADGSIINGTVTNSIISRGVRIGKGVVIKDCIIMPDCIVEDNAHLECCIIDKSVNVRKGKTLIGQKDFPIIVGKGRTI